MDDIANYLIPVHTCPFVKAPPLSEQRRVVGVRKFKTSGKFHNARSDEQRGSLAANETTTMYWVSKRAQPARKSNRHIIK